MVITVFSYGTLMFPEVMAAVTGRTFAPVPAAATDYARYALRGKCYPGLRHRPGAATAGVVYFAVDARSLRLLDRFEDEIYERTSLTVRLDDGRSVKAESYLVPPRHYPALEPKLWSPERFREQDFESFLAHCRAFYRAAVGTSAATHWSERES